MKRTFSYLLFLVILIAVIAFGYQAATDENGEGEVLQTETAEISKAPTEKPKVFASDTLGISFSYPGSWTAASVEDFSGFFIGVDETCVKDCFGLEGEVLTKLSHPQTYEANVAEFSKEGVISKDTFQALRKMNGKELHLFNKKDTLYIFRAAASYESSLDQVLESFQEIPRVTLAVTPPTDTREFKFDSCGNLVSHESQPFYADLLQKLTNLPRYHQPLFAKLKGSTKILKEDVTDVCYSQAGNIVVMLLQTKEYCERGVIVKYETDTGNIEFADFSPSLETLGRCASLSHFGKRTGRFILTSAAWSDAGKYADWKLLYDYIDNVVYPKEWCTGELEVKEKDGIIEEGPPRTKECKTF